MLKITGTICCSRRVIAYSWCFFNGYTKGFDFKGDKNTKKVTHCDSVTKEQIMVVKSDFS